MRHEFEDHDPKAVVLVVEDELFVRLMAIDAIEDAGYDVVGVETGDEALTLLDSRDDIRLLFTDIKMPGKVDGLELAERVRERWPALPILLTSGHLYQGDASMPATIPFLQKPYRAGTLIAEIDRLSA
ncbi:chemotaxis protein CheY [Sphingomonas sp. SRS2]|nr:chemotaxis protein CheY [Sphingomonas sp. SRS2]